MKIAIIESDDPYTLDYVKGEQLCLAMPALTVKNSKFIEAVIRLDSNYSKEVKEEPYDNGFDPEACPDNQKGKYCGSQKYWFNQKLIVAKTEEEYKKALLGAIISIDRANSTHLMASDDGRKCMRNRIFEKYRRLEDLKDRLKLGFNANDDDDLIRIMTQEVKSSGKQGVRYNLSFATKFCSIASRELGCGDLYSKYDSVVSKRLPMYSEIYLGEKVGNKAFQIKSASDLESRLKVYFKYNECIGKIMEVLKADDIKLDRDKIDHIIWYGFKG